MRRRSLRVRTAGIDCRSTHLMSLCFGVFPLAVVLALVTPGPLQAGQDSLAGSEVSIRTHDGSSPDSVTVAPLCKPPEAGSQSWVRCGEEAVIARDETTGRFRLPASGSAGEEKWDALIVRAVGQAPLVLQRDELHSRSGRPLVFPRGASLKICQKGGTPPVELVGYLDGRMAPGIALADLDVEQARVSKEDGCLEWKALPAARGDVTLSTTGRASATLPVDIPEGEGVLLQAPKLNTAAGKSLGVEDELHQKIAFASAVMTWHPYPGIEVLRRMEGGEAATIEIPFFDRGGAALEISHDCCARWSGTELAFSGIRKLRGVTLRRFGSISGKVLADEDRDLALHGVKVCAVRDAGYSADIDETCSTSDEEGLFWVRNLESAGYWLRVTAPDRPRMALRDIHVEPGEDVEMGETPIPPGAGVEFLVRDAGDGGPVPGATVSLAEGDPEVPWSPDMSASTDEEGVAVLRGLSEGDHPFRVSSPEHADRWLEARATVEKGDPVEVDLDHGGAISGKVLRRGEPAFGDSVETRAGGRGKRVRVDESGHYRIDGLSPGLVEVTRRSADSRLTESRDAVVREGTTTTVNFGSGSALRGLVMRSDVPVPGVRLALLHVLSWERAESADDSARLKSGGHDQGSVTKLVKTTTTDLHGEFELDGLDPGAYSLSLMAGQSAQTRPLNYGPDTPDELVFTLDTYTLSGIVTAGRTGDRLPRARISANRPGASATRAFAQSGLVDGQMVHLSTLEDARTESDGTGAFMLELPGPGAWSVRAFSPGYVPSSTEIVVDSPGVLDFVLNRESRLRVWVEGPDGLDSAGARLYAVSRVEDTGMLSVMSNGLDSSGKSILRRASGDEVWLIASHPSHALSVPVKAKFPENGERDVKVRLGRRGRAILQGVSAEESPEEGVLNVVHEESGISLTLTRMIPQPKVENDDGGGRRLVFERLPNTTLVFTMGSRTMRGLVREDEILTLDFDIDDDLTYRSTGR